MKHVHTTKKRCQAVPTPSGNGTHSTKAKLPPSRNGTSNGKPNFPVEIIKGRKRKIVEEEDELEPEKDEEEEDDDNEAEEEEQETCGVKRKRPADEFVGSMYQHAQGDKQPCLRTPMWVIPIAGSKAELVVLSQFAYWFSIGHDGNVRGGKVMKGYRWVYMTYNQLAEQTKLTHDEARCAIRSLKKAKILLTLDNLPNGEIPHYRLNPVKIRELEETDARRFARQELAKKRAAGKGVGKKSKPKKATAKSSHAQEVGDDTL